VPGSSNGAVRSNGRCVHVEVKIAPSQAADLAASESREGAEPENDFKIRLTEPSGSD